MSTTAADFLVNTGDLVSNGASPSQWQTFFDIEAPLLRERPLFAAVGNHELVDGAGIEFVRYLGAPAAPNGEGGESTGKGQARPAPSLESLRSTFRWSNARFFLINGMVEYTAGPSRVWLEAVLSAADAEAGLVWRVVVVHHGLWSSGPHGGNSLLHEARIVDLFKAHKVDVVLAGHDHIYERGVGEGLAYMVSGGGGAPVYRTNLGSTTARCVEATHHFVEAKASRDAILFTATRGDGSLVERCALRKTHVAAAVSANSGASWDCDGDGEHVAVQASQAPQNKGATLPPTSKCGCRTVGHDGTNSSTLCQLAGMLVFVATLRRRHPRASRP
jgi:hypothetical protein